MTGPLPVHAEDPSDDSACEDEFSACLYLAWESAPRLRAGTMTLPETPNLLRSIAVNERRREAAKAPFRKRLADLVTGTIADALYS